MPEEEKKQCIENQEEKNDSEETEKPKKLLEDFPRSPVRRETIEQIIQTDEVIKLLDEIIADTSPEDYWFQQAETKRKELAEALIENERLFKIKDDLIQKNKYYKMMLKEAKTVITVIQETAEDAANDTGIEVEDDKNDNK